MLTRFPLPCPCLAPPHRWRRLLAAAASLPATERLPPAARADEYINVDGGWWGGSDTGHITRNSSGYFEYNTAKYPHGIRAVSDYIHKRGFRYGHYTDAGTHACNRDAPMSEGYEHQDAFLFALEYGADMVKVDACGDTLPPRELVTRWQQQLNATGRPILYSMCNWGVGQPHLWGHEVANSWRTGRDFRMQNCSRMV